MQLSANSVRNSSMQAKRRTCYLALQLAELLQLSNLGAVLWIKRRFCDGIGVLTHSGRTTTTD